MRNFTLPELEDEELGQFETSKLMDELEAQKAATTPIPDFMDKTPVVAREMSAAEEIANESQNMLDNIPEAQEIPKIQQYQSLLRRNDELKELQKDRKENLGNLGYLQAANQLSQAFASKYGAKIGDGSEAVKMLRSAADIPVEDYDVQQKDKLNQLKLQLENEQIDPNSPLAKQQKLIVDQLAKDAGIELPDSGPMSAKAQEQQMRSLAYILGNKRQAEQARENALQRYKDTQLKLEEMRESRKEKQDIQKENELNKKVEKISKRAESQELIGKNNSLDTINNYLSSKFGVTLDSKDKDLGKVDIAGMGFLGQARPDILTPKEDVSFRQNVQSLANMLLKSRSGAAVTDQEYNRFLKEVGSGNFSSEANLLSGLKKMQKDIQDQNKNIGKIYGEEVLNEYQDRTGIKLNTAEKVKVISPDGKPGFIPKENLDKALKKGFKKAE